jgi:hypothetical protein
MQLARNRSEEAFAGVLPPMLAHPNLRAVVSFTIPAEASRRNIRFAPCSRVDERPVSDTNPVLKLHDAPTGRLRRITLQGSRNLVTLR